MANGKHSFLCKITQSKFKVEQKKILILNDPKNIEQMQEKFLLNKIICLNYLNWE